MLTSVLSNLFQFIFDLKLSGFGNVLIHFAEDVSVSKSLANYVVSVMKLGWLNLSNVKGFCGVWCFFPSAAGFLDWIVTTQVRKEENPSRLV